MAEVDAAYVRFFETRLDRIRPNPEAAAALGALRAMGVVTSVATNTNRPLAGRILEAQGLLALVDAVTGADEAGAGKPDPAVVRLAAARAGVPLPACLFVGDSRFDEKAARRAPVRFLGYRYGSGARLESCSARCPTSPRRPRTRGRRSVERTSMPADWKKLARETAHSFDPDEVLGMWSVDWRRARGVVLRGLPARDRRRAAPLPPVGPQGERGRLRSHAAARAAPPDRLRARVRPRGPRCPREHVRQPRVRLRVPRAPRRGRRRHVPPRDGARRQAPLQGRARHGARAPGRSSSRARCPRSAASSSRERPRREHRRRRPLRVEPLPGGRVAVLFGDASGHGMAAGLVMAVTHAAFRTQLGVDPSPAAMAASLNRVLCETGSSRSFFAGDLRLPRGGRCVHGDRRGPPAGPEAGRPGRAPRADRDGLVSSRHQEEHRVDTSDDGPRPRRDAALPLGWPPGSPRRERRRVRRRPRRGCRVPESRRPPRRARRGPHGRPRPVPRPRSDRRRRLDRRCPPEAA